MTPDDFALNDEIGAPPLCAFHHEVVRNLAGKDHVGDADSERVASSIARQCKCKAAFEARFNPDDRPAITPRPGRRSLWWHFWWGFTHPFGPRSQP